jgi:two-component system, cell cycle response regulator
MPYMPKMILIVEDDASIAELIKITMSQGKFDTAWAKDGEEALVLAKERVPDLILMDVLIPKMNGYEVVKQLKEIESLRHIPVIFVTVKDETLSKVAGLQIGGHDYITKPFDLEELYARVYAALRVKGENDNLREVNQRLAEMSITDPLTGLHNRRYLMERFDEEVERARRYQFPIACLMIDVDDFKDINDRHGHEVGDYVLEQIGVAMKNSNRVVDILVRYGGDEFFIILPQTEQGGAFTVAERLRSAVQDSKLVRTHPEKRVTLSIGLAAFPVGHIGKAADLLKSADAALYRAKQNGKNQVQA